MGALTLVTGDEEFLVARAIEAAVAATGADQLGDVHRISATAVGVGGLAELLSPSLFGEVRTVVLGDLQDADKALAAELEGAATLVGDGISLVSVHSGGTKGKALADALRKAGAEVVECPRVRWPEERAQFIRDEVARLGGSITGLAVEDLVAAVGSDLRELANACAQLVADSGGTVDEEVVARYHRGRAEATGFVVADRAIDGDIAGSLEALRWGFAVGLSPVLVTAALATNLRTLAGVAGAGRSAPAAVAAELGLPVWKVRKAQAWVRRWHPDRLADAVLAVAAADEAVKGGAADAEAAAEAVVLAVATAGGAGR
jgi:DNA polymerase-3 subunit delta